MRPGARGVRRVRDRSPSRTRRLPNARKALVPGLAGGILGVVLSGLLNSTVVGMPDSVADNLLHQGVSGFVSGMAGGFVGLLLYLRRSRSAGMEDPADGQHPH